MDVTNEEGVSTRDVAEVAAGDDSTTVEAATTIYEDAYMKHFKMVLHTILHERPDLRKLYSPQELTITGAFLDELQPMEQELYARLFQRKGPWFKTTSLFQYFARKPYIPKTNADEGDDDANTEDGTTENITAKEDDGDGDAHEAAAIAEKDKDEEEAPTSTIEAAEQLDNAVVQVALQNLIRTGFLATLPVGGSSVPAKFFGSPASSSNSAKLQDQERVLAQSLDALQQIAAAPELAALQKKLTGSKAKKKTSPSSTLTSNSTTPWSSKTEAFQAIKRVVMTQRRIDGSRIPLASLMHQIFLESYPLPGKSKSDVLVVQMPDTHRDLFHRMHRLFYFQSSLPFNQNGAALSSRKSEKEALEVAIAKLHQDATQWPGLMVIFKKVTYPTYEINIHHHLFPSSEAYVCYEVASRLHFVISMLEQQLLFEIPEGQEPDLDIKWMAFDSSPQLRAFQKLVETDDDGFEMLPDDVSSSESTGVVGAVDWQIASWVQFRTKLNEMTSLDDFVLESRRCFHAFLLWTKSCSRFESDAETARPAFFSKCNAGYHLARVLHRAVAIYEKQRQYQVAILLLNDLLESPFLQRKRGCWWERLALNLEHLKCADQARSTCANALKDEHVFGTDRITISRRMRRLQKRVSGGDDDDDVTKEELKKLKKNAASSDFVALLSDDDEEESKANNTSSMVPTTKSAKPLPDEYAYPKEHIVGRPLNRQTAEKSRFIGYDDEPCTVEQLVLQYYCSQRKQSDTDASTANNRGGWYGVHCEGLIIGNLFGLCIWEILYASVPDVFQTPFQSGPLDFGHAEVFYESRKELIDSRLRQLEREWSMQQILEDMEKTWTREYGKVSRYVSWTDESYLPLQFYQLVVLAMGQKSLTKLMRYMLTSPEYHRAQNGLPDLLVLRAEPISQEMPSDNSGRLTVDASGCLDIYALCGMSYQMNLNGKTDETVSAAIDKDDEDEERTNTRKLLDKLDLNHWTLQLKLVEVKGPRDRLSDKQTLWLQVLNEEIGLNAAVTYVVEDEKTLEKLRNHVGKKPKKPKKPAQATKSEDGKKSVKRQKK